MTKDQWNILEGMSDTNGVGIGYWKFEGWSNGLGGEYYRGSVKRETSNGLTLIVVTDERNGVWWTLSQDTPIEGKLKEFLQLAYKVYYSRKYARPPIKRERISK